MDLIKKYKLPATLFAELLNIHVGTVSEKMRGTRYSRFTPEQKAKITKYLLAMGKVILNELG